MKKILFILGALVYGHALFAQDIIILESGDEIKTKVQEIGTDNVKYKKYDNPSGPIYTLMKSDIFMIKYENGDKDVFKETESKAAATVAPDRARKDTLRVDNDFWGAIIVDESGNKLSENKVRSIISNVPGALEVFNSGSKLRRTGWSFIGCTMTNLVYTLVKYDDLSAPAIAGWGLTFGSLITAGIFFNASHSKWKSAVNIYNNAKNNPTPSTSDLSLNFGLTRSGGVGFTLTF
jgi:hypothetical protein